MAEYLELLKLEEDCLVAAIAPYECPICLMDLPAKDGIVLHECLHIFCRDCLVKTIEYCDEPQVLCPYLENDIRCSAFIQHREIKALLTSAQYEKHLAKSLSIAEHSIPNTFHCRSSDCKGWCVVGENLNEFLCPVCKHKNCLTCQAIHEGLNCKQYQIQLEQTSITDVNALATLKHLKELVANKDAMHCPNCNVIIVKKAGCDWLICSICKTEICWATRGPRWGPLGKGDTSQGCKCLVVGVRCHPECRNCH